MLKGISGKIVILFVSITAFAVLFTGGILTGVLSNSFYSAEKSEMQRCAENFSQMISSRVAQQGNMQAAVQSLGEETPQMLGYDYWLFESDGNLRASSTKSCPSSITLLGGEKTLQIQRAMTGITILSSEFSDMFETETLSVIIPVYKQNFKPREDPDSVYFAKDVTGVLGVLVLHTPVSKLTAPFSRHLWVGIPLLIACLAIAVIVARAFAKKFTQPLGEMREFASQMAKGNFSSRLDVLDASELADLSISLNNLSSTTDKALKKLENEQAKLNNIIDNISDGLALFNTELRLVKYNSALLRVCGDDYFQKPEIRRAMLEVLKTGETNSLLIEEKYILNFMFSRIQSKDEVEGVLVIVSDVSQSERLNRTRNEFVSNVSHEFRTPLTIIRASTEALIDGVVSEEQERQNCYEKIETEVSALERLVKDLLDTSKLRAGKISMNLKEIEAEPLIAKMVENMRMIAAEKSIYINYTPTALPPLMADYDRLRQMLIIFLDNAIKFTPENGTITVSAYEKENMAYICIQDTGVGIGEEDIPYIFERFYKVDKARGGSKTGTGLGLAIAWQIAELHHGTILVESKIGKGTTFKILIPLAHQTLPEEMN